MFSFFEGQSQIIQLKMNVDLSKVINSKTTGPFPIKAISIVASDSKNVYSLFYSHVHFFELTKK